MKGPSSFFPYRLFRWFIGNQVLLILALFSIYYLVEWVCIHTGPEPEVQAAHLQLIGRSLGVSFLLVCGVSLLMARRLVTPLGRLIEKTRRLRKFPFAQEELSDKELSLEERGEWYELERGINKLGRDFRYKTVRLSREKTELRAIMTAMEEAVLAVDLNCAPLFYNNHFSFLFRLQSWDGHKRGIVEVLRAPEVIEDLRSTMSRGETQIRELEYVLPGETSSKYFKVIYTPLRKKHNSEIYGVVAVFQDRTLSYAADKMRIDFAANASHELRTPVTSLKGYIQTLKEDVQAGHMEEVEKFIGIIERNVNRLSDLLNDLLDLSELESGGELRHEINSTKALTERVLQQLDTHHHVLSTDFNVDEVMGDPSRIEQVLRNLLQNAFRYVPRGQKIQVHWERGKEGRPCLRVKDTGLGISEVHLSRVFERFYRVDVGRSREKGGTGIGLSLVKHIMQSHGGSVAVASKPGEGTEFTCQF